MQAGGWAATQSNAVHCSICCNLHTPPRRFACTSAHCAFSCQHALSLHEAGHELGVHTRTHAGLRWYYEKKMIEEEVVGALDDIVGCGVPKSDVTGFRSPYLADSPAVREVLQAAGFR